MQQLQNTSEHGTFTKMNLLKFEITHSMISDHYVTLLEVNTNDILKMLKSFEIKQHASMRQRNNHRRN